MKQKLNTGSFDLTGLSQLNQDSFQVRVQVVLANGKKRNLKRTLHGVGIATAIQVRDAMRVAARDGTTLPPWAEQLAAGQRPAPGSAPTLRSVAKAVVKSTPKPTTKTTRLPRLGDFVEQWLMRKKRRGDLEESTLDRYAVCLDRLSPRLLRTRLDEITPDMIERWMVSASKTFAPSTVNAWHRVLKTALNKSGLAVNPAARVEALRVRPNLEEPNSLRPRELRALLVALEGVDPMMAMAAWTLAITGLRWGEVSALKWGDIDEDEGVIWIHRKVVKGKLVASTKTNRRRVVGAPRVLLGKLKSHRARLEAMEHPGRSSELLFPSLRGTPLGAACISQALKKARPIAGITQRFTSHGFRRSATDLLRQGDVDPAIAKAVIGHSTDRMREHYSTIRPEEARSASESVAALLVSEG